MGIDEEVSQIRFLSNVQRGQLYLCDLVNTVVDMFYHPIVHVHKALDSLLLVVEVYHTSWSTEAYQVIWVTAE